MTISYIHCIVITVASHPSSYSARWAGTGLRTASGRPSPVAAATLGVRKEPATTTTSTTTNLLSSRVGRVITV